MAQVKESLDSFFTLIGEYYQALEQELPDALTIDMLNHYPDSIRRFGTLAKTSTETTVELPHKAGAKKPAKRASNREALEFDAFRQAVARHAMTRHFIFLATYHPRLVCHRFWGSELDALVKKIGSIRHLNLPGVPHDMADYRSQGAATRAVRRAGDFALAGLRRDRNEDVIMADGAQEDGAMDDHDDDDDAEEEVDDETTAETTPRTIKCICLYSKS